MANENNPGELNPQQQYVYKFIDSRFGDPKYSPPHVFTFAQVDAMLILPFPDSQTRGSSVIQLPGLRLLSWSTHKDKFPVTSLGKTRFKGYTQGHRTAAGSINFVVLGENPFAEALRRYNEWLGTTEPYAEVTEVDDLPPMDLSLVFTDSEADTARVLIRGMTILDSSKTLSADEIQLTDTYSFMALSISNLYNRTKGAVPKIVDVPKLSGPVTSTYAPAPSETLSTTTTASGTTGTTNTTTEPTTTTTASTTPTTTATTTPCVSDLRASVDPTVDLTSNTWTDSGLVLLPGEVLYATASGSGEWSPGYYSYPEGTYWPQPTYAGYDPSLCVKTFGGVGGTWAADSCRPFSLALAVRADGSGVPGRAITDGYQPDREKWFNPGPGRIWLQFNDRLTAYNDNSGSFNVHLEAWARCPDDPTTTTLTTSTVSTTTPSTTSETTVTTTASTTTVTGDPSSTTPVL